MEVIKDIKPLNKFVNLYKILRSCKIDNLISTYSAIMYKRLLYLHKFSKITF